MGLFDFGKTEKKKINPSKKEDVDLDNSIVFKSVIELLGSPKKYIEDTMKAYVDKIKADKDYTVIDVKISKPQKVKDESEGKDLFSSFAELEIAVKKKAKLFDFCFNFMPSSVEIVSPMSVDFSAHDLSSYLTDIQATLHKIDFSLKQSNAANQIMNSKVANLTKSMVRMLRNNVILSLKEKSKDLKDISKNVGIDEAQLKPFIESMVADKEIKLEKGKYVVKK